MPGRSPQCAHGYGFLEQSEFGLSGVVLWKSMKLMKSSFTTISSINIMWQTYVSVVYDNDQT